MTGSVIWKYNQVEASNRAPGAGRKRKMIKCILSPYFQALRPVLEAFVRVAYPVEFPPGSLLGPFVGLCQSRLDATNEILSGPDTTELRALLDYAKKFHHDTNLACETESISDAELMDYIQRTLLFASRR